LKRAKRHPTIGYFTIGDCSQAPKHWHWIRVPRSQRFTLLPEPRSTHQDSLDFEPLLPVTLKQTSFLFCFAVSDHVPPISSRTFCPQVKMESFWMNIWVYKRGRTLDIFSEYSSASFPSLIAHEFSAKLPSGSCCCRPQRHPFLDEPGFSGECPLQLLGCPLPISGVCLHRMWKSWRDRSSDYLVDRGSEWSNRYYYVAHTSSQQRRSRREARMVREWWLGSRRDGKGRSDLHRARGTTISHFFPPFFRMR